MVVVVASGKGGTGKTTVAVNLALSAGEVQLLDCDVEAPNAALFVKPEYEGRCQVTTPLPRVNEEKCTHCGLCAQICHWNALAVIKNAVLVFPELCHSCGACWMLCPEGAIEKTERKLGMIEWGRRDGVHFVHGELIVGEALAPPLIKKVKRTADPDLLTIIDAAPGTACPAVEAVKGADACVLVTEPTPFGLNDLQLAVDLVRGLNIPLGVVVNRCDVGDSRVEDYCRAENIPILAKMPLDRRLAVHYSNGEPIVTHDATWKRTFEALFQKVVGLVSE